MPTFIVCTIMVFGMNNNHAKMGYLNLGVITHISWILVLYHYFMPRLPYALLCRKRDRLPWVALAGAALDLDLALYF